MDTWLLLVINGLRSDSLDWLVAPLSSYGRYAFPFLMLFALFSKNRWEAARSIRDGWLVWFFAPEIAERVLKPLIGRLRPTGDEHLREVVNVLGRIPPPDSLGFPSGTATMAFAGGCWIYLRWGWKPGIPALLFAALVGLSRVYVGHHWPTDILGGAVIGCLFAYGFHRLGRRIDSEKS